MNYLVGFGSEIGYRRNSLVMSGMVISSDPFLIRFRSGGKSPLETENEDRDVEISPQTKGSLEPFPTEKFIIVTILSLFRLLFFFETMRCQEQTAESERK
jgi:hypothetical protein